MHVFSTGSSSGVHPAATGALSSTINRPESKTKSLPSSIDMVSEPGKRGRYSDCLRAGRPKGRSSSPGRVRIFS
jgi:hypothetical protein